MTSVTSYSIVGKIAILQNSTYLLPLPTTFRFKNIDFATLENTNKLMRSASSRKQGLFDPNNCSKCPKSNQISVEMLYYINFEFSGEIPDT